MEEEERDRDRGEEEGAKSQATGEEEWPGRKKIQTKGKKRERGGGPLRGFARGPDNLPKQLLGALSLFFQGYRIVPLDPRLPVVDGARVQRTKNV